MQKTSLFAGEAVFDSEVIREAMNSLTVRLSPSDVVSQKVYSDTFFRNRIHSGSSFPSAHTNRGCFNRHGGRTALQQSSLGSLGRVRISRSDWVLAHYIARSFSVRRFRWRRTWPYESLVTLSCRITKKESLASIIRDTALHCRLRHGARTSRKLASFKPKRKVI